MNTARTTLAIVFAFTAVATASVWAHGPAHAKRSRCERLAENIAKPKKFNPRRYVSRLALVAKKEKSCAKAANVAYDRLVKDWRRLIPEATKPASRPVVMRTLAEYRSLVAYLKNIMRFSAFERRPAAMLMLAQLHDAMATYVEQAGTGPKGVFLVKEKGALYHDRAVDLRELLMLEAERTYAFVVQLLTKASRRNPIRAEAQAGLRAVRAKLEARKVVLPPPPPPEDEEIVVP